VEGSFSCFVADGRERLIEGIRREVTRKHLETGAQNPANAPKHSSAEIIEKEIEARIREVDSPTNLY
jgi:hypothetical protein